MTAYLLVHTEDGEDSYSLWKTEESAKTERRYLCQRFGYSILCFDIVKLDLLD